MCLSPVLTHRGLTFEVRVVYTKYLGDGAVDVAHNGRLDLLDSRTCFDPQRVKGNFMVAESVPVRLREVPLSTTGTRHRLPGPRGQGW